MHQNSEGKKLGGTYFEIKKELFVDIKVKKIILYVKILKIVLILDFEFQFNYFRFRKKSLFWGGGVIISRQKKKYFEGKK